MNVVSAPALSSIKKPDMIISWNLIFVCRCWSWRCLNQFVFLCWRNSILQSGAKWRTMLLEGKNESSCLWCYVIMRLIGLKFGHSLLAQSNCYSVAAFLVDFLPFGWYSLICLCALHSGKVHLVQKLALKNGLNMRGLPFLLILESLYPWLQDFQLMVFWSLKWHCLFKYAHSSQSDRKFFAFVACSGGSLIFVDR